ncbi:Uncharacterised protein [Mycobacteroides abscessus subsp. massiliense]|nr:Uncharacterised protein [Mycobacteroides abscessus subsp. massiliense]
MMIAPTAEASFPWRLALGSTPLNSEHRKGKWAWLTT